MKTSKEVYVVNDLSEQARVRAIKLFIEVIKEELLKEELITQELYEDKEFNKQLFEVYKIKAVKLMMAEGMLFSRDGDVLHESVDEESFNRFMSESYQKESEK